MNIPNEDDIQEFQYWIVYPEKKVLQNAKVFLLGRIILIMEEKKTVRSAKKCPDTQVALTVFKYDQIIFLHQPHGKTSLLNATTVLHQNVTSYTKEVANGNVYLDTESIETGVLHSFSR